MNMSEIKNAPLLRTATLAAAVALALGLAACDKNDDRTAGQKLDSAIAKTEAAAEDAKAKTEAAAHDAKVTMQDAAQEAKAKTEEAAHDASVKTEAMTQEAREKMQETSQQAKADTREVTANAKVAVEDAGITARVNAGLAKDSELSALRIDVDTKEGVVTLTGPAKSEQAKERATQIARGVEGVSRVVNNLTINPGA